VNPYSITNPKEPLVINYFATHNPVAEKPLKLPDLKEQFFRPHIGEDVTQRKKKSYIEF